MRTIYLNNERKYVVACGTRSGGWIEITLADEEDEAAQGQKFSVPTRWWDRTIVGDFYTHGHWFSSSMRHDLTPPAALAAL